jgi:hypothetical protein
MLQHKAKLNSNAANAPRKMVTKKKQRLRLKAKT